MRRHATITICMLMKKQSDYRSYERHNDTINNQRMRFFSANTVAVSSVLRPAEDVIAITALSVSTRVMSMTASQETE